MTTYREEVLNLISKLEDDIQDMREHGETDMRSIILQIRTLYIEVERLEEEGDYLNG